MSINTVEGRFFFVNMSLALIGIALVVWLIIWTCQKTMGNNLDCNKKTIFLTFPYLLIGALSWVYNFGWLRFIMTIFWIPVIQGFILFVLNLFSSIYVNKSKKLKVINILFNITYLGSNILFPDGGDTGEMYLCFGLIHSDLISVIAINISIIMFIAFLVLIVLQIVGIVKIKMRLKESASSEESEIKI